MSPDGSDLVPDLFVEAVARAGATGDRAMLFLLREEIATLEWALQGWRVVGRTQFAIGHDSGARTTWELVRARQPGDVEADLALAMVHRRIGNAAESATASARASNSHGPSRESDVPPSRAGRRRVVVFSGHRADVAGRASPRFPATQFERVRRAVIALLETELAQSDGRLDAIAGGASGGDILFHEACAMLGIRSTVLLALPRDQYVTASVQDGGPDWVERFNAICKRVPPEILRASAHPPPWMSDVRGYTIWQRNNLWMLSNALARDNSDVTLMVVWDGKGQGDGPGGTADMVALASRRGVTVLKRIDPLTPTVG